MAKVNDNERKKAPFILRQERDRLRHKMACADVVVTSFWVSEQPTSDSMSCWNCAEILFDVPKPQIGPFEMNKNEKEN